MEFCLGLTDDVKPITALPAVDNTEPASFGGRPAYRARKSKRPDGLRR